MAKKTNDLGFHSSLLSLNSKGTTNRTLLVLLVLVVLVLVGNVQGGVADVIDGVPLVNALIGLGLFGAGFIAYDYLFVRIARQYPVSQGLDKVVLFGIEGLFVAALAMTAVITWIAADTEIVPATLLSSALLLAIVAVAMLPVRWGLGTIAADAGWVAKPKKAAKKKRR